MDSLFLVLSIILCVVFPPAALLCFHFVPQMKVEFNFTIHFIINIILTLLAYLPGIIHAFLILFGVAQNWC